MIFINKNYYLPGKHNCTYQHIPQLYLRKDIFPYKKACIYNYLSHFKESTYTCIKFHVGYQIFPFINNNTHIILKITVSEESFTKFTIIKYEGMAF